MNRLVAAVVVLAFLAVPLAGAHAQTTPSGSQAPDLLQPLRFLVGTWHGTGTSDSGAIQGTMTVLPELQGRVLVRRDSSRFPKAQSQGALYEQMMVIAPDPQGGVHADYWDSAGHVIAYDATVTRVNGADQAQFLSAPSATAPRFRLTYTTAGQSRLHTLFEMQPPGSRSWQTIAEGDSIKTGSS